jgi:hypothetical protein
MRVQIIGTYEHKGTAGVYFESLDVAPGTPHRFGAYDYSSMPIADIDTEAILSEKMDLDVELGELAANINDLF